MKTPQLVHRDSQSRAKRWGTACLLCCLALVSQPSRAASISGVRFVRSLRVDNTELQLVGVGLQRYMLIYKVCAAGFYLAPGVSPDRALDNVAKRLEIAYFHEIRDDQFAEMTTHGIRKNTPPATFATLARDLQRLNDAYQTVSPGDRYSLTYVPGNGMTLALNGKEKAAFRNDRFAKAVFSIWLGEKPLSTGLKDNLLGR